MCQPAEMVPGSGVATALGGGPDGRYPVRPWFAPRQQTYQNRAPNRAAPWLAPNLPA